jgi:predicted RNA-binding protein YlxR (DUF448 family)
VVKKIPQRRDLVTGEMFDKSQLLRIVIDKQEVVAIDKTGRLNGRGAYVQIDNQAALILKQKRLLDRALKTKVDDQIYDQIIEEVDHLVARRDLLANEKN